MTFYKTSCSAVNNHDNEHHESSDPPVSAACEQCRSRKVRCDRRLPQCSHCEKAGVVCEFPRRIQRVNPPDLLREIITPRTNSSQSTQGPSLRSKDEPNTDHELSNTDDVEVVFGRALDAHSGDANNRKSPVSVQGPSTTSTLRISYIPIGNGAMLKRARGMLEALLQEKRATSPLEDSDSDTSDLGIASHQGWSVALPPHSILIMSLQLFLDEFNTFTPIFNQSLLRQTIDHQYSLVDASKVDMAYSLCFNNIIVLATGLRARFTRLRKLYPMGMNENLLPAFLENSFRALHHLKDLIQPRHVNLQALATLALVAREYHESHVFNQICHLACNLLKSMPDPPRGSTAHSQLGPMDKERRDLYWTLFVLDKQRTCVTGHPFDLHFYNSDVYRQRQVERLDRMAHKWCSRNPRLFSECSMYRLSPAEEKWRLELRYAFHLGQVLIHSCSNSLNSKQVGLQNSQASMRIIREVLKFTLTEASLALLCRLLRNYPLLAVHYICIRFLKDPSVDMVENLELIASVHEALGVLVDHNLPSCCLTRTQAGVAWYLDVVRIVRVPSPSSSQPSTSHVRSSRQQSKRARNTPAAPSSGYSDKSALSDEQKESGSESAKRPRKCSPTQMNSALQWSFLLPGILAEQDVMPPLDHPLLSTDLAPGTPSVVEMSRFLHDAFPPMNNAPMVTSENFDPMIFPTRTTQAPAPDEPSFNPSAPAENNVSSFLLAETIHASDAAEPGETDFDFGLG
ncbi:Fungal Zn(2)-Cys(6) binuclear cluster domain-containing protein [Penicillium ucsense]|uniref:Fungal Zn(2)-Cys(6) binuclear cluster domain-containing protein n=1 Tax=Penicillium ucsense TaxID=2839758 RepID=A0A8J8VZJ9_9EURO|nr:Fungal Zn(2)-Cys(6) binuclear cluster domain-containing protein [Penicillium ucsense]KAF7734178.1 Fungal Zn(2)-Cys(6) binuclear cluster domain-containing protein [Penicillium ucsense]